MMAIGIQMPSAIRKRTAIPTNHRHLRDTRRLGIGTTDARGDFEKTGEGTPIKRSVALLRHRWNPVFAAAGWISELRNHALPTLGAPASQSLRPRHVAPAVQMRGRCPSPHHEC